ncbi:GAF domain-containing protein [Rhodoflexus caldus]|uniref:GAF domain-containing protein n=1 Tax=Rhodoflexus caldus TaxID=2891236 RepID=UPI002029B4AD|nr:GAF domain-containing protein [Rhodoflexus caldus]
MRFFNLASFKGQLNLVFTLLLTFNIIRFGIVIFSTATLQTQANQLRLLNNIRANLKDIETEFNSAKLSLMHLMQGFMQDDRQSWQARFKRNILNMTDLQKSIALNFDSLDLVESKIVTDSLAIIIQDFENKGLQMFAKADADSISYEQRKQIYEEIYLSKIEDEIEPALLKLLYFNLGKNYVDDRRLVLLEEQSTMISTSGDLNTIIFFITLTIIVLFWYLLTRRVNFSIGKVYNKLRNILTGKLVKDNTDLLRNELKILDKISDQITDKLVQTVHFVDALGQGKYDVDLEKFNDDDHYSSSLLKMRDALRELAIRDSKRNWANETTARFSELLRDNTKTAQMHARSFLQLMVAELHAQVGGIYLAQNAGEEKHHLALTAAYAYGRDKSLQKTIAPGEGLCGQCYLEGETIVIRTTPQNFFTIPAGIGDIEPTAAAYVPIKLNNKTLGVLEIASVRPFEEHQIDLMEKVCTLFAATVESIQNFETNSRLLEQSQMLAEDLRSREEEMRQNMEELTATQEEMMRSQTELFNQFEELEQAKLIAEEKLRAEQQRLQKIILEKEHIIEQLTAKIHS